LLWNYRVGPPQSPHPSPLPPAEEGSARGARAGAAEPPLPLPDKPSIAVLPFANMSGDPEQEYFADGMVEEIITALSRIRWLFVIARNSSFTYKGQSVDVKQVGRELGVRYVLEGSVRKAGGRVRITGQLIEATSGTHLWAAAAGANCGSRFIARRKKLRAFSFSSASNLAKCHMPR
jgi:TolB-like protein